MRCSALHTLALPCCCCRTPPHCSPSPVALRRCCCVCSEGCAYALRVSFVNSRQVELLNRKKEELAIAKGACSPPQPFHPAQHPAHSGGPPHTAARCSRPGAVAFGPGARLSVITLLGQSRCGLLKSRPAGLLIRQPSPLRPSAERVTFRLTQQSIVEDARALAAKQEARSSSDTQHCTAPPPRSDCPRRLAPGGLPRGSCDSALLSERSPALRRGSAGTGFASCGVGADRATPPRFLRCSFVLEALWLAHRCWCGCAAFLLAGAQGRRECGWSDGEGGARGRAKGCGRRGAVSDGSEEARRQPQGRIARGRPEWLSGGWLAAGDRRGVAA